MPNTNRDPRDLMRPGSQLIPLVEWPTYRSITVVRTRRGQANWSTDSGLVPEYQRHLSGLDLSDPTPASEHFAHAKELRKESMAVKVAPPRDDIVSRLATGDLDPAAARKLRSKQPTRAEAATSEGEHKAVLAAAARQALLLALRAIHDHDWLSLLKTMATEALSTRDEITFRRVHRFAAWLRDPSRNQVFGLAAVRAGRRGGRPIDAEMYLYQFRRPDLVYRWRAERATDRQRRELYRAPVDGHWRVAYVFRDAPEPTLADCEESWGLGFYSAEEVVANIAAALKGQEAEFARLAPPVPPEETKPKRGRLVVA